MDGEIDDIVAVLKTEQSTWRLLLPTVIFGPQKNGKLVCRCARIGLVKDLWEGAPPFLFDPVPTGSLTGTLGGVSQLGHSYALAPEIEK